MPISIQNHPKINKNSQSPTEPVNQWSVLGGGVDGGAQSPAPVVLVACNLVDTVAYIWSQSRWFQEFWCWYRIWAIQWWICVHLNWSTIGLFNLWDIQRDSRLMIWHLWKLLGTLKWWSFWCGLVEWGKWDGAFDEAGRNCRENGLVLVREFKIL